MLIATLAFQLRPEDLALPAEVLFEELERGVTLKICEALSGRYSIADGWLLQAVCRTWITGSCELGLVAFEERRLTV